MTGVQTCALPIYYLQAHQLGAIDSFIAKYSTHEISAAREYIASNNVTIVKVLM